MAKKSGGKSKTQQSKVELVFNEKDRRDYLTGFKKRKQKRREMAMKKFDMRFKQEKNRIRLEKRASQASRGPIVMPDNMLISEGDTVTHELEQHTVSVSHIADINLRAGGLFLGPDTLGTETPVEQQDEGDDEQENEVPGMELKGTVVSKEPDKPVSQRSRQKILQTKMKQQEKKNKKKSQNLQKHKARVRKKHMKLSHQLKRQKRKGGD